MLFLGDEQLTRLKTISFLIDKEAKIVYASGSIRALLGYTLEEITGKSWYSFLDESRKKRIEHFRELEFHFLNNPEINHFSVEKKMKTKYDKICWMKWNISRDENGMYLGIGQDISDLKKNQVKLNNVNRKLAHQKKEIQDSIAYAKRLQDAILPEVSGLHQFFADAFVLNQPKDIVSGDFYWFTKKEDWFIFLIADCTGHGVPGALMSILAHSVVRNVIRGTKKVHPAAMLAQIDKELVAALNEKENGTIKDGMDIALCAFQPTTGMLRFAGAFRPLIMIRDDQFSELPSSRFPIGFFDDVEKEFIESEIQLKTGDQLFLFTDGYVDQFGGAESGYESKKLNKKGFKELLHQCSEMKGDEKESYLSWAHSNWRQHEEQTDDVLVQGVKI